MNKDLRVVLDTNVLLVSISKRSKYHWLYEALIDGEYNLYVTNEILMEYEEVISAKYNIEVAKNVLRALLLLPNVIETVIYYNWNLINNDPDDNKFVDCAIAANVHFLVSNDRHFNVLSDIDFPKLNCIKISEFKNIFI